MITIESMTPYPMKCLVGQVFGRLTVIAFAGRPRTRQAIWTCRCECGKEKMIYGECLKRGSTTSCGCFRVEDAREKHITHGGRNTPEYRVWNAIKYRCQNPKAQDYSAYGQRGIKVCAVWSNSFAQFLADMGTRPEGMTIERKDVNGNYEPSNCIWATARTQANNRRNNRTINFSGRTQTISEWSRELGIDKTTIKKRLDKGWSPEACLKNPA